MTTKDLLACATPQATKHIQKAVNLNNKTDYKNLKKLFDEQHFVTNNFSDTELNITTFDWQSLERDRNWWWQLQALPFLNWYANSLGLQTEEERTRYFSLCLDAVHCWINSAKQNKESPLVWHDHAAAFRMRNLTNWLLFCHNAGLPVNEEVRGEPLASLVIEHLDWIQKDKHYSKHTNHGFDQAMIALTIGLMFNRDDFEPYRQRNRERLKDEVTFAFTDEGVHKENSPGYQKMMLGRLKQLRAFLPLGEREVAELGERYIEKAETFLRAITLPDGCLPMIGDTQGGELGLPDSTSLDEGLKVYNYGNSGYVIIKGKNQTIGPFFLLVKNCHFSNYHRHDDDLMIYLWCNGDVILGDGGLYSHNEKSNIRKFMRSPLAHSIPYIKGRPVRDRSKLASVPKISFDGRVIYAESFMFGSLITRKVDITRIAEGIVKVRDGTLSGPHFVNYFFGERADARFIKKGFFQVDFLSSYFKVTSTARFYGLFKGEHLSLQGSSYLSERYNVVSGNLRILFSSTMPHSESTLEFGSIGLEDE